MSPTRTNACSKNFSSQYYFWAQSAEIDFVLGSNVSGVPIRPHELSLPRVLPISVEANGILLRIVDIDQRNRINVAACHSVHGRLASTSLADPSLKTTHHRMNASLPEAETPAPPWPSLHHPRESPCHITTTNTTLAPQVHPCHQIPVRTVLAYTLLATRPAFVRNPHIQLPLGFTTVYQNGNGAARSHSAPSVSPWLRSSIR
jgi:hypothetical protein